LGVHSLSGVSGDKTEAGNGGSDYWVLLLDTLGNIAWQQTYGGSANDYLDDIRRTEDGCFLLSGNSASGISGDKTEDNEGATDYWIVKIDSVGNFLWDRTLGGDGSDEMYTVFETTSGNIFVAGATNSDAPTSTLLFCEILVFFI